METAITPTDKTHEATDPEAPFRIEVVHNGTPKHLEVAIHELIKTVLTEAIRVFHVTQQQHLLSLFNEDGTELADTSTVQKSGVERHAVLYLRQSKVKGGIS